MAGNFSISLNSFDSGGRPIRHLGAQLAHWTETSDRLKSILRQNEWAQLFECFSVAAEGRAGHFETGCDMLDFDLDNEYHSLTMDVVLLFPGAR